MEIVATGLSNRTLRTARTYRTVRIVRGTKLEIVQMNFEWLNCGITKSSLRSSNWKLFRDSDFDFKKKKSFKSRTP